MGINILGENIQKNSAPFLRCTYILINFTRIIILLWMQS